MKEATDTPSALRIAPGQEVFKGQDRFVIRHILDFENVLASDCATGRHEKLRIADLTSDSSPVPSGTELAEINDEDWAEATRRYGVIRPLLNVSRRTAEMVRKHAKEATVHPATVYRWLRQFERTGRLSALISEEHSGGRGKIRINADVERIIQTTIEEFYLTKQRRSVTKTCDEVLRRCKNASLPAPHPNTVRNRISALSERIRLERRSQAALAAQLYTPKPGRFPGADWPLAVVQIDHTKLDIILVDAVHRAPIGRPWITLAIDVFSRMVAGFHVSFDPPSAMSVGLCVAHSILPKEKWISKLSLDSSWPVWGKMKTIHVDNAREFRGVMLERACAEHGIDVNWRPVATPHFGGHIERMLGTLAQEIHTLPGTTFSNPGERAEYNSDANAALTLPEFERWLTLYLTQVYHQRLHTGIGTSPINKFEQGIFGTKDKPGVGLPDRILDENRLRLDFMPYVERTVQPYGVVIDDVHYYSDVLRAYVNSKDDHGNKEKFIFRRDPRDISVIYFFAPDSHEYCPVPYRDTSRPAISIWELREARNELRRNGASESSEALIFEAYEQMRRFEEDAKTTTRKVRRSRERRVHHREAHRTHGATRATSAYLDSASQTLSTPSITPFEEMEEI